MNIFRCVEAGDRPQQLAWLPCRKYPTKGPFLIINQLRGSWGLTCLGLKHARLVSGSGSLGLYLEVVIVWV